MLIVSRYVSETILQKTFVIRSVFGMAHFIFLTELPLFLAASQCRNLPLPGLQHHMQ